MEIKFCFVFFLSVTLVYALNEWIINICTSMESPYVKTRNNALFLFFKTQSFLYSQGHIGKTAEPLDKMVLAPPLALARPKFLCCRTLCPSGEAHPSSGGCDSNPSSSFNPDRLLPLCFLVFS